VAEAGPSSWSVAAALAACRTIGWSGEVWRCHGRAYPGDSAAGSPKVSGRFNRGRDKFPAGETWAALYTSLGQHVALGERIRHTTPRSLAQLGNQRISRLRLDLQAVLDGCALSGCTDLGIAGLSYDDLCHPRDYSRTQEVARIVQESFEALLIPSCTRFPEGNLIVFPDRLRQGSTILLIDSLDPDLFVDWDSLS
jgi:hypothetical protein